MPSRLTDPPRLPKTKPWILGVLTRRLAWGIGALLHCSAALLEIPVQALDQVKARVAGPQLARVCGVGGPVRRN